MPQKKKKKKKYNYYPDRGEHFTDMIIFPAKKLPLNKIRKFSLRYSVIGSLRNINGTFFPESTFLFFFRTKYCFMVAPTCTLRADPG